MRQPIIKLSYLAPLFIFLILVGFLLKGLFLNPQKIPSNKIGKPAPDFTLPQLYQNSLFSPKQLIGKKWILNVWASWCPSCAVEHPLLNTLSATTDITLVGLNYKDKPINAKNWLDQKGNPYQFIASDRHGDIAIDYGVYGAPETFVINEEGIIIYKHIGALSKDIITQDILPFFTQ